MTSLTVRSHAKINLTLRVLGTRRDGYHELRTVFQTLALHDTITFSARRGPLVLSCSDAAVPGDERNLAWKAAAALWQAMGRTGEPQGIGIRIVKRIPVQAGLGGGSSNAAATLRALVRLWRARLSAPALMQLAATLGADVPFFLRGGTALGLDRGDRIFPLPDWPPAWVALVLPDSGVSTAEAYGWYDRAAGASRSDRSRVQAIPGEPLPAGWPFPPDEGRNDLEPAVVRHLPELRAIRTALAASRATYAAMSGSGSAVFGLFGSRAAAGRAVARCERHGWRAMTTRTTRAPGGSGLPTAKPIG